MKRNSKAYRLQLIKEIAQRRERRACSDPMVRYIDHLLTEQPGLERDAVQQQHFAGHHYDDRIDGWVSDRWK
jgi:hypothetical protein